MEESTYAIYSPRGWLTIFHPWLLVEMRALTGRQSFHQAGGCRTEPPCLFPVSPTNYSMFHRFARVETRSLHLPCHHSSKTTGLQIERVALLPALAWKNPGKRRMALQLGYYMWLLLLGANLLKASGEMR
jgi:hypothetical protein